MEEKQITLQIDGHFITVPVSYTHLTFGLAVSQPNAFVFTATRCACTCTPQHNNRNDNATITLRPFLITYTIIYFPLNISHSIFPHKKGLLSNLYTPWAESHKIRKNIVLKTFKHAFFVFYCNNFHLRP